MPMAAQEHAKGGNVDEWLKEQDRKWDAVKKEDERLKAAGELLGRYIFEPYADGRAVYKIVGLTKTKAKIEVCTGLGDDWEIPYWGSRATIDRAYAERSVTNRDALEKMFIRR